MKTNILSVALSVLTMTAFAQKDEIKDAEDAVEDGNYAEAKAFIDKAEPKLSEANDKWTERFYLYKGQAYLGAGKNVSVEDAKTAAEAFQKAADMGSEEAEEGLMKVRNSLVQSAVEDQNTENYEKAADKLYASYELNKQDTVYLYYAAANSLNAQNYDAALGYYEMLRDLDYDGSGMEYTAVNVETGQEEVMPKDQRDLMVKSGQYKDPQDKKLPSKKGEIAKNIALIYISQEKNDKAIAAMESAKAENPGDVGLLQAEANMYYQMGDKEKYRELMEDLVEEAPDDPSLYYNLGVSSAELGKTEKAIEYYKKALELDPDMNEARMNIVVAILAKERDIIDEMNGLGMSKEDDKRYKELMEERKEIYKEAIPYLEKVIEKDPQNINAIQTAMNIYSQLDMPEKAKEMKAMLEQ
ncbi:tetratricopeptide repeat protein [Salegentibacter chungangensis]|uniref:Tetratricopeptide repeat protein n=1 Tax=Salegentibacter chungangensis TaxID=1335724 RepID=A0ABW3NU49_9FLAO